MTGLENVLSRALGKEVKTKTKPKFIIPPDQASATGLQKYLDFHLSGRNEPYHRQISGFHPSYKAGSCVRWWYLLFDGAESQPTFTARTYRIFDNGNDMHERYYKYFREMGILVEEEYPISLHKPVPIVGTCDGIIDWNGQKVIELKSISPEGFEFRRHFKKPLEDHYDQIQLYLYCLKLEEGYVIYESKGSQENLFFRIIKDDDHIDKILRRFTKIYAKVLSGDMPKRPYLRTSKQCSSCDLQNYCWDVLSD